MKPTTLTKSRFVQAIECPRKLVYATDQRYYNARKDDDFLEALAQGGHLVGTLAKLMHPGGIEITARSIDEQVMETNALLDRQDVVLFEPTIRHGNLVVRVDVLVKQGDQIELIEVKSKSAGHTIEAFGKRGHPIKAKWRPYIYDVAFQKHVLELAHPEWSVSPYLMVPDTSAAASMDGVASRFSVERSGRDISVHVDPDFDPSELEEPLLRKHDISAEVGAIINHAVASPAKGIEFVPFIDWISSEIAAGNGLPPYPGNHCKRCEFYCAPDQVSDDCRSGWNECMQTQSARGGTLARPDSVFGLWNYRRADKQLAAGNLALHELQESDLEIEEEPDKITLSERHWLQVEESKGHGEDRSLETTALRDTFDSWEYPLHFIDFETCRPALPFHVGRHPYDQLLFQFSHHVLEKDGRLHHAHQSLVTAPGVAPTIPVLRDLQRALDGDNGTVVHWWDHERTVLREIQEQVDSSNEPDRDLLSAFVDTLVGGDTDTGRLADLGRLVLKTAFFQNTSGSSSIKKVLPAVLCQSDYLKEKYRRPIYGTEDMPSLNFPSGWTWLVEEDGKVKDPYMLLSPLFADSEIKRVIAEGEDEDTGNPEFIANGGAAMAAYESLQKHLTDPDEKRKFEIQLLRYCELDTLAMVMIYEALNAWTK